jgi:hypothetical protein
MLFYVVVKETADVMYTIMAINLKCIALAVNAKEVHKEGSVAE